MKVLQMARHLETTEVRNFHHKRTNGKTKIYYLYHVYTMRGTNQSIETLYGQQKLYEFILTVELMCITWEYRSTVISFSTFTEPGFETYNFENAYNLSYDCDEKA